MAAGDITVFAGPAANHIISAELSVESSIVGLLVLVFL